MSHKLSLQSGRYALSTCKLTLKPDGNHYISGDNYTDFYWFTDIEVFINSDRSMSLGELVNKFLAYEMDEQIRANQAEPGAENFRHCFRCTQPLTLTDDVYCELCCKILDARGESNV